MDVGIGYWNGVWVLYELMGYGCCVYWNGVWVLYVEEWGIRRYCYCMCIGMGMYVLECIGMWYGCMCIGIVYVGYGCMCIGIVCIGVGYGCMCIGMGVGYGCWIGMGMSAVWVMYVH